MKCTNCNNSYQDSWNRFCVLQTNRCIDCQKKWEKLPENDPKNKKYIVEYEYTEQGLEIIYAENADKAREEFGEEHDGEITSIYEQKRKGVNNDVKN